MIRAIGLWFWRRRLRRMLVGAGCHDVRFVHRSYREGFDVGMELGVRAGYGESDFTSSMVYSPHDRRSLGWVKARIESFVATFAARTIPSLALDGRPPDIGARAPDDLAGFG